MYLIIRSNDFIVHVYVVSHSGILISNNNKDKEIFDQRGVLAGDSIGSMST